MLNEELFANAIVIQAIKDYAKAYKYEKKIKERYPNARQDMYWYMHRQLVNCENFFRSQWFQMLCDVDGELIMKKVRDKIDGIQK